MTRTTISLDEPGATAHPGGPEPHGTTETMIFGFDIGGTTIRGAEVLPGLDLGPVRRAPTPARDFDAFVSTLRDMIAAASARPEAIAISLPGVMNPATREALCANIPCLNGRRVEEDLASALGLPVVVANDADCFTVAEARAGAGRGHRIVFGAILGTGIGGGLVVDGRLINATGGFAGEWGHAPIAARMAGNPPVEMPRLRCGCGLEGCLETLGSARGIERLDAHFHARTLAAEDIIAAAEAGDLLSRRTVGWFVEIVSAPLAMVVNVTGATIVPVGGGLSNAPSLLQAIDEAVRAFTLCRFSEPVVVRGQCRHEPGIIGAALLAGVDGTA